MMGRRTFLQALSVLPITLLMACGDKPAVTLVAKGAKVVALGDSLTFGYGAEKNQSYPTILAQKTGWDVVNMGINGDTTADVLNRLEGVVAQKPKLVLLGIGGNDVLRRVDRATTKNNLLNIINTLQSQSIPVVLIAEPHFSASALFGKASDNPVYKEVADELSVPLFANGWSKILSDDSLKSDQTHANGAGYAKFAEMLFEFLKELGYV